MLNNEIKAFFSLANKSTKQKSLWMLSALFFKRNEAVYGSAGFSDSKQNTI